MKRINVLKTLTFLFFAITVSVSATNIPDEVNSTEQESPVKNLKTEIKEYINHHLLDSYDFTLYSYTNLQNFTTAKLLLKWMDNFMHYTTTKFIKPMRSVPLIITKNTTQQTKNL